MGRGCPLTTRVRRQGWPDKTRAGALPAAPKNSGATSPDEKTMRPAGVRWFDLDGLAAQFQGIQTMKILLVEDDRKIGQFVKKGLEEVSYATVWVRSRKEAQEAMADGEYDVVILDIGLPDGNGLELLTDWREKKLATQVLILSARHEVDEKITGLNLGADDYLTKPFSFGELLARLRSLVRRHAGLKKTLLEYRGIRLDLLKHEAALDGVSVPLTQREFALLEFSCKIPPAC